ncbi:MAG TPA: RidA family protein [Rhizomicrobium sp.]|jgi:enamine deaminase RidA (YjgF/YER057c/UK114 family)|nr:RidA family protein [Rhizomicrobium sp.]
MSTAESRLKKLGVTLPAPPVPVASYVPYTVSGNLVFISGQIPVLDGALKHVGKLGADMPLEEGQEAAQLCAINVLAQLKAACRGDLDRVSRCLKLGVFVNATPEYGQHPEVANGASDLIAAVFGESGKHARAAVGVGSLPRGVAVEVDAIFEIK